MQEQLITQVIQAGISWLIGLLGGPAGAFIRACKAIIDVVSWFMDNAGRLASLANAIIEAVNAIAAGNVSGAAAAVENALARFVPTAIGFLASLLGLGNLSRKVREVIERVQAKINQAIDSLLEKVRGFVMQVAKLLGVNQEGQEVAIESGIGKEVPFQAGEESHRHWVEDQGGDATLMVASSPKSVEAQLAEWEEQLPNVPEEQRGQAQGLLGQARSLLGQADTKADFLAEKKQSVKKLDDADPIQAQDRALEGEQEQLAGVLAQLFELFDTRSREQMEADLEQALAEAAEVMNDDEATVASVQETLPSIQDKYDLTSLTLVKVEEFIYQAHGKINPEGQTERIVVSATTQEWYQKWQAKREEVREVLAQFVPRLKELDSNIELNIRGSLASGISMGRLLEEFRSNRRMLARAVREGREPFAFNPESFDVDAYVVVDDRLFQEGVHYFARKFPDMRIRPGQIIASKSGIGDLGQIVREMREALAQVPGNRDSGELSYRFNVVIRSKDNAMATVAGDQNLYKDLGNAGLRFGESVEAEGLRVNAERGKPFRIN